MNSEVPAEKSRRNASRLPSESKSLSLRLSSENRQQKSEQDISSRHWTLASEGFPPGVTVDELKHYRRRRAIDEARPEENPQSENQIGYKSEYRRHYRGRDLDNKTKPEGEEPSRERTLLKRPQCNLCLPKDQPMESVTEKNSQYISHSNAERRKLLRRSTALKPEGEMTGETEVRSQFKPYENPEKAQPLRRSPSLKLEGDFERMITEQREKFINHLFGERPLLRKKNTLLKMEGDFDFLTEKQVSYVPHERNERPFPRKRSTSLKLDGEVEFFPEYRSSYIDFPRSRPITYKPTENLRNEGELEIQTETKTKYIDFQQFPVPLPARPSNNLLIEGGFDLRPEYKENYIDFPRSRPFTMRPENHLKQEGEFDMRREKEAESSKILGEDVKRPLMMTAAARRRGSNLKLEGEFEFSTEKMEKFKGHEIGERLPPARRYGNLLLEGEIDFKTETEEKYVANAIPEGSDFRRKSSFLQSGGEFRSVLDYERMSPRGILPSRSFEPVRSKVAPFKTEVYESEIMENCKRRNSKRLKDEEEKEERLPPPPRDRLRLETEVNAHCQPEVQSVDDDRQPSFRLEVYNVDSRPQGFHPGNRRVFPAEGIPTERISLCPDSFLEKKRNDYYGRSVNSPNVPNYILDKNNNLGGMEKTDLWTGNPRPEVALYPPVESDSDSYRPNWLST